MKMTMSDTPEEGARGMLEAQSRSSRRRTRKRRRRESLGTSDLVLALATGRTWRGRPGRTARKKLMIYRLALALAASMVLLKLIVFPTTEREPSEDEVDFRAQIEAAR